MTLNLFTVRPGAVVLDVYVMFSFLRFPMFLLFLWLDNVISGVVFVKVIM
jgi:hypothetical protein